MLIYRFLTSGVFKYLSGPATRRRPVPRTHVKGAGASRAGPDALAVGRLPTGTPLNKAGSAEAHTLPAEINNCLE